MFYLILLIRYTFFDVSVLEVDYIGWSIFESIIFIYMLYKIIEAKNIIRDFISEKTKPYIK